MLDFFYDIDHVRILAVLVMLSLACVLDVRKREVSDLVWVSFGGLSVALLFVEPNLTIYAKGVAVSLVIAPVVLFIWRVGFLGGADALCLITLAVLAPEATLSQNPVTPLTVLSNGLVISMVLLVFNLGRNLFSIMNHNDLFSGFDEGILKKTIALFIGYRSRKPGKSFIMEKVVNGQKRFDFAFKDVNSEPFLEKKNVWVTPAIPYVVYLLLGFIAQIFIGDIILELFYKI